MSSELLNYIVEKPRVQQLKNYIHNQYNTTKNCVPLVGYVASKSYNCASYMVEKVTPVAAISLDVSKKIIKPVVGEIENPVKSLDHYACEKLKNAEQTLDTVVACSQQRIHNARLKAEDFFIGKCVHTAYQTTNSALGRIESTLENMSLIRKRKSTKNNNDDSKKSPQSPMPTPLSQNDFDRAEFEFLKYKQFEARQNLLNIFANPELWRNRMNEYRMLTDRVNDLHKRIITDGFLSNVHFNLAHLVSFYATTIDSIVALIISSAFSATSKIYEFNKNLLLQIKTLIQPMAADSHLKTPLVIAMFSQSIKDVYINLTNKITSTYEKLDFLIKLYFRFFMARMAYFVTNNLCTKTNACIRQYLPFAMKISLNSIDEYTTSLAWILIYIVDMNRLSFAVSSIEYNQEKDDNIETITIEEMDLSYSNDSFLSSHSDVQ